MRLLHTADWHVGKSIRGRSRMEEFAAAVEEVVGIAIDERVDVVLVAGDVYDHRAPAPDADLIVFDALLRLHAAGIRAVIIPGNHDSALRFAALGRLLEPIGATVVASVRPPERGGVVEIPSRDGAQSARIACVPFVPERRFGDAADLFEATETWYQSYADGMGELLTAMSTGFRSDRVNVLVGHLFTDGARLGGGERELTIGMAYAIPPARLPATAQYVALGHVHRPQAIQGAASPARFAGSLLQLDFGERDQRKSVSLVEADPGAPSRVREIHLTTGRRLIDLHGTLDEVLQRGAESGDAYVRAFVTTDGPVPGIADRIRAELPSALDVHLVYDRDHRPSPTRPPVSALAPREQFLAYFRSAHGADPEPPLLEAFDELLAAETEGP